MFHYFVHGIEPEDYIKTNRNIFDYCGQTKARGVWKFKHTYVDGDRNLVVKDLQKTLRYYVSKSGTKIIKNNTQDDRNINVEAGTWVQQVFNTYEEKPFEEYGLDMRFYLEKIKKEIKAMQPDIYANQIKLDF